MFDARTDGNPIAIYQPHQRAVIRLAMSSHFILSASEDKTVSIWDQRAGKTMKTVTVRVALKLVLDEFSIMTDIQFLDRQTIFSYERIHA